MSHSMLAPAPIRSSEFDERIAPILIRIPAVERRDRPHPRPGARRRRLRREVRGALWVLLGIVLGWAVSTYRTAPEPEPAFDPSPVLVRLSIEEEPSASASALTTADEPSSPIALKGFLLPSESR